MRLKTGVMEVRNKKEVEEEEEETGEGRSAERQ